MMKKLRIILTMLCLAALSSSAANMLDLQVSDNKHFLQTSDGKPFFWLGDTGWLLPSKLNHEETQQYLITAAANGYNVVQIQTISCIDSLHSEYYWQNMDYIIREAEKHGIYIGMNCIWGGLVKQGLLDVKEAKEYGTFLAERYKACPNIVWIIGGDIQGNIKPEVWNTLATTIKSIDHRHLMTYHPRGRYTSAKWWAKALWIDFHMYQSGHRAYGQRMGDKTYSIPDNTEEDCWMYVDSTKQYFDEARYGQKYVKPILDGEPSYEDIPKGLHNPNAPLWKAYEVRRYAYWDVFSGNCGHTYGHNAIMQMHKSGDKIAYSATCKPWYEAQRDSGYMEMKYLKELILSMPSYFDRVNDQSIIKANGTKYDRLVATRGKNFILVYNYILRPMTIDTSKLGSKEKELWWMDATNGKKVYIGDAGDIITFDPKEKGFTHDGVLIIMNPKSQMTGAYTKDHKVNKDEISLFNDTYKGRAALIPISVSTQVVAGTNYMFICKGKDGNRYKVVIYQKLPCCGGKSEVTSIEKL